MSEALTRPELNADHLAFIRGERTTGTRRRQVDVAALSDTGSEHGGIPSSPPMEEHPVSMTFRLPADLPAILVQVSAARKVRRQSPFSQQDIVAQALREWLTKHGR